MPKRYFVRYLESASELIIVNAPPYIIRTSFSEGLSLSPFNGHRRKKDAIQHIAKVNTAIGRTAAEYAGAFDV